MKNKAKISLEKELLELEKLKQEVLKFKQETLKIRKEISDIAFKQTISARELTLDSEEKRHQMNLDIVRAKFNFYTLLGLSASLPNVFGVDSAMTSSLFGEKEKDILRTHMLDVALSLKDDLKIKAIN